MSLIADIATGHTGGADVLFLIAVILAGVAAVLGLVRFAPGEIGPRFAGPLLAAAVACVAAGFLVL